MGQVFVTTYELIGDGVALAESHFAEIDAAQVAHWAFIEELGGVGFRPSSFGGLRSVFFTGEAATGWRKIGGDGNRGEYIPRKGTKAGKALAERIAALPQAPQAQALSRQLGYSPPHMAIDGGKIYFETATEVAFPSKRYFIRLPRFADDGFEPDEAIVRAMPESEFMKAIEDHNAEAKRLREVDAKEPTS